MSQQDKHKKHIQPLARLIIVITLLLTGHAGLADDHKKKQHKASADTTNRLRITSDCDKPLWIFHTVGSGGGTLNAPSQVELRKKGDHYDYAIHNKGLASTRFWPGAECDAQGNN